MTQRVKAIPEGYHTVTPFLVIKDAAKAIEFYKQAFGAKEVMRFEAPNGKMMHARQSSKPTFSHLPKYRH